MSATLLVTSLVGCGFSDPRAQLDGGRGSTDSGGGDAPADTSSSSDAPAACGDCRLFAIDREIASPGEDLGLDGTFSGDVVVRFPGNVDVPATVLGAHRARVTVPAGATSGDLTLANGSDAGSVALRVAPYAVGLGSFGEAQPQAANAQRMGKLSVGHFAPSAIAVDDFIYVIGGLGGSGYETTIEAARIGADGTLGTFAPAPSLAVPAAAPCVVRIGDNLYTLGGDNDAGALATVQRAAIDGAGAIDAFAVEPSVALTRPRGGASEIVLGSSVFVIGGFDIVSSSAVTLSSVDHLAIGADFRLATADAAPPLVVARRLPGVVAIGDFLYVVGGEDNDGGFISSVERAAIRPDGSLGDFAIVPGVQLVTPRRGNHATFVIGDRLYAMGGVLQGTVTSIESAPILADGSLGQFSTEAATTPNGIDLTAFVVAGDSLYRLGGDAGGSSQDVSRASLDASGGVASFVSSSAGSLSIARSNAGVVTVGTRVFVLGGTTGASATSSIEVAQVSDDGTLGAFAAAGALAVARQGQAVVSTGQLVYVLGGRDGGGAAITSIEKAAVEADGTLGAFQVVAGVTLARSDAAAVVSGNTLFVIGGLDASGNALATVATAPIAADGSLGAFTTLGGVTLATARSHHQVAVVGNQVYVVGGSAGGGTLASVERATLSGGSLSTFSAASPLATAEHDGVAVRAGNSVTILGGTGSAGTDLTTVQRATVGATGQLGAFSTVPGVTLEEARTAGRAVVTSSHVYTVAARVGSVASATVDEAARD